MNGMLSINFKYNISGAHWQQFSHDVVNAFNHPIFNALKRVRDPEKVIHFSLSLSLSLSVLLCPCDY